MGKLQKSAPWQLNAGVACLITGILLIAGKEYLPYWCYTAGGILFVFGMIGFISGLLIPVILASEEPWGSG